MGSASLRRQEPETTTTAAHGKYTSEDEIATIVAKDGEFRSARCTYDVRVERAARRFRLVVTPSGGSCELADRTVFEHSTTKD